MTFVPPYLRELNPEQRAAAADTEGPVLILAGAGSGKTRTLVHRIVHLLRGREVDPRRVLAVTFTNKAASEMRERVAQAVGPEARRITVSTFHSLGVRLLREHGERAGLPKDFTIYSTADQLGLLRRLVTEEVRVQATAGDDRYDLKRALFTLSGWKNRLITPAEARREVAEAATRGNRADDYAVLAADLYPRYDESLRAAGACDFDDLLLLPVRLLRDDRDAREAVWKRWHYLLVDEYQDTNSAQLEIARLIAGPRRNLCVVGDDDQSIYAWRGADHRNILDFERHFPDARVHILEENYRSTQRILDAANAVIARNTERRTKQLRTGNGLGPLIDYWELGDEPGRSAEAAEAELVAREIGIRKFGENRRWNDFAVLYRTNHQSRPLEEALRAANLPYRVVGGTSYFDRKEVVDALAYLRVVLHPRDEVSLRRIINYPVRGIGRTTLFRLIEAARATNRSLWETLQKAPAVEGLSRAAQEAIARFVTLIREARADLDEIHAALGRVPYGQPAPAHLSLEDWVRALLRTIRLEDAVRAEAGSDRAAEVRTDHLRDLIASVGAFETRTWDERPLPDDEEADWAPPGLVGFLERVTLAGDEEERADRNGEDEAPDAVTLMTLHSAKGLEFSHVFLVGLEEEILPHARTVQEIAGGGPDPIAEERRLFYVGITRARHRLTLSGCRTRRRGGDTLPRQPSRFLKDIPPDLLHQRSAGAGSSLSTEEKQELKQNFSRTWREILAG